MSNLPRFTIATLVTDPVQHRAMVASFRAGGFDEEIAEVLCVDNSGPRQVSAYAGLNRMLAEARGEIVILCHQDVRLIADGRAALDARLGELEAIDPAWALAGNAGGTRTGELAMRISDPHGRDRTLGRLPARVMSLDENFIIVRRAARIGFSRDLEGFHFYGADICLMADIAGWSAYVVDFHLEHLSPGRKSADFFAAEAAFRAKWSRALRSRLMQTTCALVPLTGGVGRIVAPLVSRPIAGLARRLRWPSSDTAGAARKVTRG